MKRHTRKKERIAAAVEPKTHNVLNECDTKRMSTHVVGGEKIVPDEKKENVLVLSALPYSNNHIHLGGLIGYLLSADVMARYYRMRNNNVLFISGTDELGTATETMAVLNKVEPKEICDKFFPLQRDVCKWFNISLDHFGRTTNKAHGKISRDIYNNLDSKGLVTERIVENLYCEACRRFLADRFVYGTCPKCGNNKAKGDQCDDCDAVYDAVLAPKCLVCNGTCTSRSSMHKFLELPALHKDLESWFNNTSGWSKNAASLAKSYYSGKMEPRCITRNLKWATPIYADDDPRRKDCDLTFYPWFDAPIGYMSITADYYARTLAADEKGEDWLGWWYPDADKKVKIYQFMGKDNVYFHSVMFPATLIGSSDIKTCAIKDLVISATEHLQYGEGKKFSKSLGIGVFGNDAISSGIPADIWRYYLLYNRPETSDTVFNWDDLLTKTNGLANDLGNLVMRSITLAKRMTEFKAEVKIDKMAIDYYNQYLELMNECKIKASLKLVVEFCQAVNAYFSNNEPWKLIKSEPEKCCIILITTLNNLYILAHLFRPFVPDISSMILLQLNLPENEKFFSLAELPTSFIPPGHAFGTPVPIIDVLTRKFISSLESKFGKT